MVRPDVIVGIIGNILSILTYLSPLRTFREIVKKKSTKKFDGLPYIITLLNTSLWAFYGLLDVDDGILLVTTSSFGVASQLFYVILFLIYAPKPTRVKSLSLLGLLNVLVPGTTIALTLAAFHGSSRRIFIGVVCATFSIASYAAPLKIMGIVIRTKSVEYMPFLLSFFLFLNGVVWTAFGLLVKDIFVVVPNAIGAVSGSAQLIIYVIYRSKSSPDEKGPAQANEKGIIMQDFDEDEEAEAKTNGIKNPSPASMETIVRNKIAPSTLPREDDVEKGVSENINHH